MASTESPTPEGMKTWRNERHGMLPDEGPWVDEPDKAVWVDDASGLDCMIHRGPLGALCGYVGVGPDHPLHGKDYWGPDVEVHGGLTYADSCHEGGSEEHGICHVPAPGRPHDVWWFGFDCAHSCDLVPAVSLRFNGDVYRDFAYVVGQVTHLAHQLAELDEDPG